MIRNETNKTNKKKKKQQQQKYNQNNCFPSSRLPAHNFILNLCIVWMWILYYYLCYVFEYMLLAYAITYTYNYMCTDTISLYVPMLVTSNLYLYAVLLGIAWYMLYAQRMTAYCVQFIILCSHGVSLSTTDRQYTLQLQLQLQLQLSCVDVFEI